jgi:hypothetical protein
LTPTVPNAGSLSHPQAALAALQAKAPYLARQMLVSWRQGLIEVLIMFYPIWQPRVESELLTSRGLDGLGTVSPPDE